MGTDQQFCLRWNNFHSNIASSFEHLRDHEDFVDVTLACEGNSLKAHKVVLSACSPYFKNLLKQNPCQHPIIILRDVAFIDLTALLSFVYQGEVYVSQDRLSNFLRTAEMLHIKGLTEQTHQHASGTILPVSVGSSSTMILPSTSNNIINEGKPTTVSENNVVPSVDMTQSFHLPVHLSPPQKKRKSTSSTSQSPTPSSPEDASRHEATSSPLVESGTTFTLRSRANTPVLRSNAKVISLSPSSPKSVTRIKQENEEIKKETEAVNLSIEGSVLRQRIEGYNDCSDGQYMDDCNNALQDESFDDFPNERPLTPDDSNEHEKDVMESTSLVIRSPLVGLLQRETSSIYGSAGTSSLTHDTSQDVVLNLSTGCNSKDTKKWPSRQPVNCQFCGVRISMAFNLRNHVKRCKMRPFSANTGQSIRASPLPGVQQTHQQSSQLEETHENSPFDAGGSQMQTLQQSVPKQILALDSHQFVSSRSQNTFACPPIPVGTSDDSISEPSRASRTTICTYHSSPTTWLQQ